MGNEWPVKSIAECAANEPYATQIGPFGKALMADEYTDSGVPVLRGVNVNQGRFHDDDFVFVSEETADRLSKYESSPGDVLLVHKGTIGQIGLMPRTRKYPRYIMGNSMLRVRCDPSKMLPEHLYYWLSSSHGLHYLTSRLSQVGVPQIQRPLTTLREAVLPVPPVGEQRRITDILGTLDDKIELNRQMNRTLEAMVRAIFKAWFVDFEPVKAKAAGATSFRGMPQAVFDQLPDRFTDTELGPAPEGWEVKPISSIASLSRDSITPADSPDEIFEHFSIPAFDAGKEPARDLGGSIKSNKYKASPHCVLVSKLNPRFARVWLPDEPVHGARQICSTEFLVITPREGWSREQLYCQFVEVGFRQMLEQRASGTSNSHQRIKPKDFEKTTVVSPSVEARDEFSKIVEPLFAKAANLHREAQTLAAIRDTLLPKLISGELRVQPSERASWEGVCH